MEQDNPFTLVFGLRIVIAVVVLFVARSAFDALRPASAHSLETQVLFSAPSFAPGTYFVHTSTVANMSLNWTYIDHPLTNSNPDAIVLITQSWNPGGGDEQYHPHPIGVWYSSSAQKWAIFNQDLATMITGVHFNVLIPATGPGTFVHTAAASNISGNSTYINHPLTNNNPDAIVFITQNWNPGGGDGTYNNRAIGVWYSSSAQKWAVFNENLAAMPSGAAFNVLIPDAGAGAFVHTTTTASRDLFGTVVDHPLTNNNPNAIVFATQNWNPGGGVGTYNTFPIGVSYRSFSFQKWSIQNQTVIEMPVGAAFNVVVMPYTVYLPLVLR
ncbi:MAG: hypothetical protein MUQ10_11955 [Anaerolineae bacterium]|nr:hypothetical protein [Anaerolineae bacterium]